MKNTKFYTTIVLILLVVILIILYMPIKFSVKINELNDKRNYIVTEVQKATIAPWTLIDVNGYYFETRDIRLTGNEPTGFNLGIETAGNKFVCYGSNFEKGFLNDEQYHIFNVEDWDIVYPIKRKSFFKNILPKKYLSIYDYIQ